MAPAPGVLAQADPAEFAVAQRPGNREVLGKWVARWSARADDAAHGLGQFLESLPEQGRSAGEVAAQARAAREDFLGGLLDPASVAAAGRADRGRRPDRPDGAAFPG